MAKLSRTQRYQELRDQLDEETTKAQSQPVQAPRLSRVSNNRSSNSLPHSEKAYFPHENTQAKAPDSNVAPSPVIDELLGEVKRYNIENGNRFTADTQINILKQLDDPETESRRRKQHTLPMEEPEESFGTTMELPKSGPVTVKPAQEPKPKAKIVLTANDIRADEFEERDNLDVLFTGIAQEEEITEEVKPAPVRKKAAKKKKKKKPAAKTPRKPAAVEEEPEMPSAKMRMKLDEYEEEPKKKGGKALNVILAILIIALIVSLGAMFYYMKKLGLF